MVWACLFICCARRGRSESVPLTMPWIGCKCDHGSARRPGSEHREHSSQQHHEAHPIVNDPIGRTFCRCRLGGTPRATATFTHRPRLCDLLLPNPLAYLFLGF